MIGSTMLDYSDGPGAPSNISLKDTNRCFLSFDTLCVRDFTTFFCIQVLTSVSALEANHSHQYVLVEVVISAHCNIMDALSHACGRSCIPGIPPDQA